MSLRQDISGITSHHFPGDLFHHKESIRLEGIARSELLPVQHHVLDKHTGSKARKLQEQNTYQVYTTTHNTIQKVSELTMLL